MDRSSADVEWSDEQWNRVTKTIQESAQKARVAAQFIPTVLHPDATAVAAPDRTLEVNLLANQSPNRRLTVDSTPATFFTSFAVNVALTSQEMSDPEQSAALIQFRRAASIIARLEDALIFCGQSGPRQPPPNVSGLPAVYEIGYGGFQPGLVPLPPYDGPAPCFPRQEGFIRNTHPNEPGRDLATSIIDAIGDLEAHGHNGPFACVLGQQRFSEIHSPTASMVLPRDRVMPFLEGPLLRSSTIPTDVGIVVALGAATIEIVASSELHVRFLQITTEPRYVFRVSERIALRLSDWTAIVVLRSVH